MTSARITGHVPVYEVAKILRRHVRSDLYGQDGKMIGEAKLVVAILHDALVGAARGNRDDKAFLHDERGAAYVSALGISPVWWRALCDMCGYRKTGAA